MKHAMSLVASPCRTRIWPVTAIAILSWISIVVNLDPAGSYPNLPEGPGLTIDEIFNVEQGVYLIEQTRALGWLNLLPGTSQEAYRTENGYNPDHPPLGRIWLGVHHHLAWWLFPPRDPDGYCVTACARTGSATAFALLVLLIGWLATKWSGEATGILTALSLVFMPRVYGHAHLASLESVVNLTFTAAVLAVAALWTGPLPPKRRAILFAGFLLGLALLTKIQAVLIPIPVIVWLLWRWRVKALIPLILWGLTGCFVFAIMWPYVWSDPLGHGMEYLRRATHRSAIQVWYFGHQYADRDVPWHYPFVMFGLTVPLVLQTLGILGLFERWIPISSKNPSTSRNDPSTAVEPSNRVFFPLGTTVDAQSRDSLLLMCMLFPLIVFAMPGVAVYDGERLFLTSFPLWAIFIGRGWMGCWRLLLRFFCSGAGASFVCSVLLMVTAIPLVSMSPCHLCYYNPLAWLIRDSDQRESMLELDYWGVGVTRGLIHQLVQSVPPESTVAIVPTLHQFQAEDYRRQSPILRAHGIRTVERSPDSRTQDYVLIYGRQADLPEKWKRIRAEETLGQTIRGGRMLAYFIKVED